MNKQSSFNNMKYLSVAIGIIMILCILPYLFMTQYAVPLGDDYRFTIETSATWEETHSIIKTIKTAWDKTIEIYNDWQGSISGVFLMAIGPMTFSLTLYRVSMLLSNILLIVSVFFASKVFLIEKFKIEKHISFLLSSTLLFSFYVFTPDAFQAFFWNNGSVYYIFTFCLSLMFACLLEYLLRSDRKRNVILMIPLSLLAIFFGLNNLPNALFLICAVFVFTAFAFYKKLNIKLHLLIILSLLILSLIVNILAPGNSLRITSEGDANIGIISALLRSFILSTKNLLQWFARLTLVLPILLIFTPYLYKKMNTNIKFFNPFVLIAVSFLLFTSHYTPTILVSGTKIYGRVENIRYLMAQIIFIINYLNLLGYLAMNNSFDAISKKLPAKLFGFAKRILYPCLLLVTLLMFLLIYRHASNNDIAYVQLVAQIRSGAIKTYSHESEKRIDILNDESIDTVEFEPLTYERTLIGFDDITIDEYHVRNKNIAAFYNKQSVRLSEGY